MCNSSDNNNSNSKYNKTKALQTQPSPFSHHMEYKKEKDEQGRLRRRFLQDFFMEYGLENNFMGNANATQTGKASSYSYSHRHCLRAQRMPNV